MCFSLKVWIYEITGLQRSLINCNKKKYNSRVQFKLWVFPEVMNLERRWWIFFAFLSSMFSVFSADAKRHLKQNRIYLISWWWIQKVFMFLTAIIVNHIDLLLLLFLTYSCQLDSARPPVFNFCMTLFSMLWSHCSMQLMPENLYQNVDLKDSFTSYLSWA